MSTEATKTAPSNGQSLEVALKRCFVISPIGADGSEVREHADDVFDYIITPAMEEVGVKAIRSDHLHEPGLISEQMLSAILEYDLCIAVLTFHNPNVFYELAIAQAAARPLIILLDKSHALPFDIKDLRCVYYDLKPRSLFNRVHADQVVEHVEALRAANWTGPSIPGLSLGGQSTCSVLPSADDFGSPERWLELLEQTEEKFAVSGINLHDWRKTPRFMETAVAKAANGCRIRAVVLHPESPVLPAMINDLAPTSSLEEVKVGLMETIAFFGRLATEHERVELRLLEDGCLHFNLTVADDVAVAVPYLYSTRTAASPLMRCEHGSPLYSRFDQEFEALWAAADAVQ